MVVWALVGRGLLILGWLVRNDLSYSQAHEFIIWISAEWMDSRVFLAGDAYQDGWFGHVNKNIFQSQFAQGL